MVSQGVETRARYRGAFPVVPTTFDAAGDLDLESQKRAVDFVIDSGADGICILANFSEQFALADEERDTLAALILEHVAGRVPVIVTTTHYSSRLAAARSRRAQDLGAAMVMLMPPYHGATIRAVDDGVVEFFKVVAGAIDIPIMIQDAPVSGVALSVPLLARMAREIDGVAYFKIEVARAADKIRDLLQVAGPAIEGPFDGEESITLLADLDAGATGTMPSSMLPDVLGRIVALHREGRRPEAIALYERYLPMINFENRQCWLLAAKALMQEGGIIASDAVRHPTLGLRPATRAALVEMARRLDPLILRWAR